MTDNNNKLALMPPPSGRSRMVRRRRSVGALLALWAAAAVVWWAAPAERAMAQTVPDTTPVNIPDANLRAALETVLGKAAGATITRAEMAADTGFLWGSPPRRTRRLDHRNWNSHLIYRPSPSIPTPTAPATVIRDLTGLEYLTAIQGLSMIRHRITDLRPLAGLTEMRRLWLDENLISDLSPLRGLPLDQLSLKLNPVSDLSPLAGMVWLATFNCDQCQISDISPLAGLTRLRSLDLQNNYISDISPLTRVNDLSEVFLSDNRISDLSPLANRNLRTLTAAGNRITDLSPLRNSLNMETLDLNGNQGLRDVSVVERMVALKVLRLDGTDVRDLSPLVANTGLGSGDQVYLRNLPNLNADAEQHVATLRGRGVSVRTSSPLRVDKTVRGVAVTPGVERLTVTWNPPTVGYTPGFQRVYWWFGFQDRSSGFTPPQHHDVPGDASSYTIPNLTPGVVYKVQIYPLSPTGDLSAIASGIPLAPAVEDSVSELRVRPAAESLVVSWQANAHAHSYRVQWRPSGAPELDPADQVCLAVRQQACGADGQTGATGTAGSRGTVAWTIAELEAGTEYRVFVTAMRGNEAIGETAVGLGTPYPKTFVSITAADGAAGVVEGGDAKLLVRLSQRARTEVTVTWTTQDGTAKAGEDYREMAGSLTFQPNEQEAALTVPTLQDRRVEPAETFRVLLAEISNAGRDPEAAAATVTITDDDTEPARRTALSMVLAGLGRWSAADAVAAIEDRFRGRQEAEAQVSVSGHTLALAGSGAPGAAWAAAPSPGARFAGYRLASGAPDAVGAGARLEPWMAGPEGDPDALPPDAAAAELISQSRFNLPLSRLSQPADGAGGGAGGNGGLRIWVQGAGGGFGGRPTADFRSEGTVLGGYLGIDAGVRQDALVGLAMAHSRSEVDYTLESVTSGTANLTLTSMLPYAHWRPRAGLEVWGLAGVGLGDAALQDEAGKVETDLLMWLAAGGVRQQVATWREVEVAVQADAFLTELKASGTAGLPHAAGNAGRLRLRLAGSRQWELSPVSRMTPRLEVGGRWDGGSDDDGLGVEVGGGLGYTHTDLGLEVEAQGRVLLAHSKQAFGEWGGGLRVKVAPGQAGQGPWLTFAPGWGQEESRTEQMWDSKEEVFRGPGRSGRGAAAPAAAPNRLALETGWGVATHGGAGLVTPYAGLSLAGSELNDYRLGARLNAGSGMNLGLEGRGGRLREYEVMLYGRLDW